MDGWCQFNSKARSQIRQQSMNNPRGTYMNKPKTNAHMTSAHPDREQRTTIINTSVSKQGETKNAQSEQEKRITRILEVAGKLENPTNTPALSRQTLKTGSNKAFFDVLCIFLRAIDGHTERADFSSSSTNTELLQDALKFFGYKGNCNKSLFQPIGAPHTWKECLAILEWFSQLAAYAYNFQSVLQQNVFEEDQNSLMLKSFKTKNDEMFTSFIHRRIEHLEADIANNLYTIESKQMAINNLHAGQKDLASVMRELEKERELAYRSKQEAIAAQADAKAVEVKIQAKQAQLAEAREKVREGDLALEKIRYQIIHQELPPEQCEKLKLQIRDTKNKISEIEQSISENLDIQKSLNKQYLESFTDRASQLRKMADKLQAMSLVHQSEVPLQLPTVNPLELSQFLRNSFQNLKLDLQDEAKLEAIFKERQFGVFFRKQDEFVAKCEAKFTREEEDLLRQEQQVQATDAKCKDLQEYIDRLERSKKEKDVRSSALQAEKNELTKEIAALEAEIAAADTEIALKTLQKDGLIKEVREALSDLREMQEVTRENERRRKEMIQRLKDRLENQKKVTLEKIQNYKKGLAAIFNSKLHVNQDQQ